MNDTFNIAYSISFGIFNTLLYTILSVTLGFIFGNLIAIHNSIRKNFISRLFNFLISIIRGTPLIVQLFIVYFGIPHPFSLSGFSAVIITLSLNSCAYMSEIIRAGIQSIDKGQFEASETLSISKLLMWKDIIMPQVYKNSLPSICNEFINLLKETAIVTTIGENDILRRAQMIGAERYSYLEPLIIAAVYYYILIFIMTKVSHYIEKKINYDQN